MGFCISVFKDLQWSFTVVNGRVLNTSPKQSTIYYVQKSKQSLGVGLNLMNN